LSGRMRRAELASEPTPNEGQESNEKYRL